MKSVAVTKRVESNKKIFPVDPETIFEKPKLSMEVYKKIVSGHSHKKTKLRCKKALNYLEISLESTPKTQKSLSDHVPVYLQSQPTEKKIKKDNLYDFDDDSFVKEEKRKLRKRKLSDVNEYDKAMDEVLKRIRNKMENRQREKQKHVKKKTVSKQTNKTLKTNATVDNTKKLDIPEEPPPPSPINFEPAYQSDNESCNGFFGFNSENEEDTRPKVVILSNQLVIPGQNFNETNFSMSICANPNSSQSSPWRTELNNVTRNPHFFSYKKTLVPNYNQEMVLNSTIVEQIPKTPLRPDNNKKTTQSTLSKYITTTEEEPENNANVSLFDIHQLSPIKKPEKRILMDSTKLNVRQSVTLTPDKPFDIDNYFGFNSEEKENQPAKQKIIGKPTRINFDLVPKIIPEENQKEIINIEPSIEDLQNSNEDLEKLKLFEDLESSQMKVSCKRNGRKFFTFFFFFNRCPEKNTNAE